MAPYDPILDYCGIVIQFGYVTFFSVVWQVRAWHVHSLRDMRVACAVPCAVPCAWRVPWHVRGVYMACAFVWRGKRGVSAGCVACVWHVYTYTAHARACAWLVRPPRSSACCTRCSDATLTCCGSTSSACDLSLSRVVASQQVDSSTFHGPPLLATPASPGDGHGPCPALQPLTR